MIKEYYTFDEFLIARTNVQKMYATSVDTNLWSLIINNSVRPINPYMAGVSINASTLIDELRAQYHDYFIGATDDNDTDTLFDVFTIRLCSIMSRTHKKYDKLLALYESEEAHLLDSLKSTTTTAGQTSANSTGSSTNTSSGTNTDKYVESDTPQEIGTIASMTDLSYASRINQNNATTSNNDSASHTDNTTTSDSHTSTTTTDTTTIINRLNEIDLLYKNVYNDWCKEFATLFIPN